MKSVTAQFQPNSTSKAPRRGLPISGQDVGAGALTPLGHSRAQPGPSEMAAVAKQGLQQVQPEMWSYAQIKL